jgi:50S ribosomal protein L16 3-hydroxylase
MLKDLSPDHFLADYWQKQSRFLRSAVDRPLPVLDANELAWLATQPDVESRLVFTDRTRDKVSYRVEHGPFEESALNALPAKDWTLLVQDVEKHLPDFREYFQLIPFIPSWRIDDLMVSCAAPGGSVGPHKDNYDVFLCQGEGTRDWLVSDDRSVPADLSAESLSLLEPFEPTEKQECRTGDVLYAPPGIPHWGIAKDLCITYSIGMRAPTQAELAVGYSRIFSNEAGASFDDELNHDKTFYTDADLQACEALIGQIAIASARRLREQRLLDESLSDEALITVLGSVVTDPKAWLDPDGASDKDVKQVLGGMQTLRVHGMALITWCVTDAFRFVFVNGSARRIPEAALDLVEKLCVERVAHADVVQVLAEKPEGTEFIRWLLEQGIMDIG